MRRVKGEGESGRGMKKSKGERRTGERRREGERNG